MPLESGSGGVDRNMRVHMRSWRPAEERWTKSELTIHEVLDTDYFSEEGSLIIRFPEAAKVEHLQKYKDPLRHALSDKFKIPSFFWSKTAWDANGFFGAHFDPMPVETNQTLLHSYSLVTRFLIKSVKNELVRANAGKIVRHNALTYAWDFIGFYTLWLQLKPLSEGGPTRTKQILLCFDLNKEVWEGVRNAFDDCDPRSLDSSPYGSLAVGLQSLILEYDKKLWSFRVPIRDIEKNRLFIKSDEEMREDANKLAEAGPRQRKARDRANEAQPFTPTKANSKLNGVKGKSRNEDLDRDDRMTRYENIHELQRHIIHSSETLRVAATTLEAMYDDTKACDFIPQEKTDQRLGSLYQMRLFKNTQKTIKFCTTFLNNLEKRAQAFDDRLKNEINLDFNSVAAELQSQNATLTTTVSVITLLFLPGSFFASFFGSNFFNTSIVDGSTDAKFIYTKEIWIYFVVTVPITLVALGIWIHQTNRHLPRWVSQNFAKLTQRASRDEKSGVATVDVVEVRPWHSKLKGAWDSTIGATPPKRSSAESNEA